MNIPLIAASARASRAFIAAPRRRVSAQGVAAVLVALLLVASGCANVDALQEATTAYKKRDYPTALRLWRPLAEQGNAAAQKGLGELYEFGLGVPKDEAEAAVWYRKAAEQGAPTASSGSVYSISGEPAVSPTTSLALSTC
jgi:TPR repeat protein